jgi:membrane protease YdiL (CAAX protease family)
MTTEREQVGSTTLQKVLAVLEVMAIYTTGQMVIYLFVRLAGITLSNPLQRLTPTTSPDELLQISWDLLILLLFQYSGWFILILPIGWWHRRRRPEDYGVTRAGHSVGSLVVTGVVLFCVADLSAQLLGAIDEASGIGTDVPWREALFALDWTTWQFWLLMAIGSFALIPIVEELFYRGYCQSRLVEDLGPAPAIVAVALMFTLSHSQYHIPDLFNVTRIATLVISALAWGYVFYRTRSLVPVIVAHVLINLPLRGPVMWVELVVMSVVCVLARRPILDGARDLLEVFKTAESHGLTAAAGVLFATFAVAFVYLPNIVPILGLLAFVAVLVLIAIDRRKAALARQENNDAAGA